VRSLTALLREDLGHDVAPFVAAKATIESRVYANATDTDRFPLPPQVLVSEVRRAMPSDGIISLDNGMYKIWFARTYVAHEPNTVLLDNALATMGAGLPAALGAKVVHPGRKVVAICGDGGFMMNSQELETAKRLGLDLVVLILRDDAYGMIKWKQEAAGFDDFGLDFGNPDFVAYARSYGVEGTRVGRGDRLSEVITRCFERGGVQVIDVPIDYSDNRKVLLDELRSNAAAAVEQPA
jgi:acetolactate synthase-1/2/3 large subunit